MKKENVSILKAAVGIELIDSTHSDEHEHGGEETHSDELEHESEEGATEDHVHEDDGHDHGDLDPRVWLDPVLAIDLSNNIKNSLSDIMPEHASEFESNFLQLKSDLEKLIQDFKSTVDNSKTKYLLVSHAAYGYWESRYGIEEIAIASLSPSQVPSQKELPRNRSGINRTWRPLCDFRAEFNSKSCRDDSKRNRYEVSYSS